MMAATPGKALDVVLNVDFESILHKFSVPQLQSDTSQVDEDHPAVGMEIGDETEIGDSVGSEAPVTGDVSMSGYQYTQHTVSGNCR